MTYRVSVWDHEQNDWRAYRWGLRKWTVRRVLRELYGMSYDRETVFVEQEPPGAKR